MPETATAEQTATSSGQTTPAGAGQGEGSGAAAAAGAATGSAASAGPAGGDGAQGQAQGEGTPSSSPSFESDAEIEAFIASHPKLTSYTTKVRADAANQAVQRAQNEAARRYSDEKSVADAVEDVLSSNAPAATKQQRIANIHALARRAAGLDFANGLFESSLREFEVPIDYREKAALAWARIDPETGAPDPDYDSWLRHTAEGAAQARVAKLKLADVPEGSPLHADVRREITAGVEAELRAKGIAVAAEGAPKTGPAATRSEGPSGPANIADAKRLTEDDWSKMSDEDVASFLRSSKGAA